MSTETVSAFTDAKVRSIAASVTTDAAKINSLIVTLGKSTDKIKAELARLCASLVLHTVVHGNVTVLNNLVNKLADTVGDKRSIFRLNAIREWIEIMGPVDYDRETKGFVHNKRKATALKAEYKADKAAFTRNLIMNPFWIAAKPEKEYEGWTFQEALDRVFAMAERQVKKHGDSDKLDLAGFEEMKAAYFNWKYTTPDAVSVN